MSEQGNSSVFLPESDKKAAPKDLFFIWFAANMGIMGIVYGAIIIGFGLSFFQSLLVAIIGPLSFLLVGVISLAGRDSGVITFVLSRAPFGFKGNYIPALIGWIGQVGWLSVNVSTGTLTILTLFTLVGVETNTLTILIGLLVFAGLVIASSAFTQDQLVSAQTFFTYVFGGLTLLVILFTIPAVEWDKLLSMSNGPWLKGFFPAVIFVAIGTGITWTNAAADYSRFQKRSNSSFSIIANVTLGAVIPLFVIIGAGILLASFVPNLADVENPISAIISSGALPKWLVILYTLAALGGLTPMCFIGLKSSRLIMSSFDLNIKDSSAILIHSLIIIIIPVYVLIISQDFLGFFQAFLDILGTGLAAWAAIFLMDLVFLRRKGYDAWLLEDKQANIVNTNGVFSWIIGIVIGLLFTDSEAFTGPFAVGIFSESSLGVLLTFLLSGLSYIIFITVRGDTHGRREQ